MDRGACQAPVHGVTKSRTQVSDWASPWPPASSPVELILRGEVERKLKEMTPVLAQNLSEHGLWLSSTLVIVFVWG